jgi:hypothetical protein
MEVTKLVINGIEITTLDKPIGLEVNKLSLDRDFQYSCIDTKIEAELKFYCASGKSQLDAEYESKGIEALGYVDITDNCGSNANTYRFNLDFKKYNNQGDYTTVGLIDVNSLWKQDLNKEVNLDTDINGNPSNNSSDFYVRNLPLQYLYNSTFFESAEEQTGGREIIDILQTSGFPRPDKICYIFPKSNIEINELEEGNELLSQTINVEQFISGMYAINAEYEDVSGAIIPTPSVSHLVIPSIEPQEVFYNELEDGEVTLTTNGDTGILIDFTNGSPTVRMNIYEFKEIIAIGTSFDNVKGYINQLNDSSMQIAALGTQINYQHPTIATKSFSRTFNIKKGERVWVWYQFMQSQYLSSSGDYFFQFSKYSTIINRSLDISFTLTKNVTFPITTSADVEPFHTKTKAYYGQTILSEIFKTSQNFAQTPCYNDLWFSKGDLLRGKINKADTIVKPSDFFRELEKIVCCGLGYFYDTNPSGEKRLMSVYDFYSDDLVPSQYQFDYNDLINGKIELSPFLSPYYKEIQIGYSNFKDSPKDYSKQNTYSIDNISESTYSKISDFIASQYIITRALRLGTEDKELEFDNNIFILSGGQLGIYNATLSQTSGVLADSVFTQPLNTAGINRRYATALNLFRHLYKWGFSLFANKTDLKVVKYEGNSIYDYGIRDTSAAMPPSPVGVYPKMEVSYHKLSKCYLPYINYAKVDRSIDDIYTDFIQSGLYVPTQITFKTANLSSLDLIAMRAHQYDLFSVTDGVNTYYGNLISANLENEITEIKLLRRFKNGI